MIRHEAAKQQNELNALKRKTFREIVQPQAGPAAYDNAFKVLNADGYPSLHYLKAADGTFTSDPDKVDEIMKKAWQPIYKGNGDTKEVAKPFISKYAKFIVRIA